MKSAEHVTFGGSGLDRGGLIRGNAAALQDLAARPGARTILMWRGKPLVTGDGQIGLAHLVLAIWCWPIWCWPVCHCTIRYWPRPRIRRSFWAAMRTKASGSMTCPTGPRMKAKQKVSGLFWTRPNNAIRYWPMASGLPNFVP